MKLSLSLLREFVPIPADISPGSLSDLITTSIAEVEGFEVIARENVVVAKVLSVAPHPNADRLRVARVTDGKREYQVVCGGMNLEENRLVAFAYTGARVRWHGQGEEITLEKVNLRGVESEGMICASEEIGLKFEEGEREILDLTGKLSAKDVGKDLYAALGCPGEVVFEIDNKSLTHRPDLFGHYGFARDIAVVLRHQLGLEATKLKNYPEKRKPFPDRRLDIRVESKICQAFSSILIEGVKVGPSPAWLQRTLLSVGIRPINNIVDVTNYVMIELGQPMHAYDYAQIRGGSLTIRQARRGEKALALNGKEYELESGDSVVSDSDRALLIVGIMGCENSGIGEDTTSVLLEAGSWDPVLVRKMAQRLGLRSDASTRFEKDLDPHYTTPAILRAVELISKLVPKAKVASALFEYSQHAKDPREISLDLDYASRLLGITIDQKKAQAILHDLGCTLRKGTKGRLLVTPPTWRSTKDLLIAEDLVEELGRVLGYGDIPYTAPEGKLFPHVDARRVFERKLKDVMARNLGYHEVENYSLTDADRDATLMDDPSGIEVANPLTKDARHFKNGLIPDLLRNATLNARLRQEFRLFETSRLYRWDDGKLVEFRQLAGILARDKRLVSDHSSYDRLLFRAKEDVESLFTSLGIGPREYHAGGDDGALERAASGQSIGITVAGRRAGRIVAVPPNLTDALDLFDVVVFELDLAVLEGATSSGTNVRPLPKFPLSIRDIALVVEDTVTSSQLEEAMGKASPLVRDIVLFDVFEGPEIGDGNRSLAYHLTLGSDERTLTEEEITTALSSAQKAVEKLGAKIRG